MLIMCMIRLRHNYVHPTSREIIHINLQRDVNDFQYDGLGCVEFQSFLLGLQEGFLPAVPFFACLVQFYFASRRFLEKKCAAINIYWNIHLPRDQKQKI